MSERREIRRHVRTEEGRLLEAALNRQFLRAPQHLTRIIHQNDSRIIEHTIRVQREGENHRGFRVGVTAVGLVGSGLILLEGANHSPTKGIQRNCGEMAVDVLAYERDQERIRERIRGGVILKWLYVSGPSDREEIRTSSGLLMDTLLPCDECRPIIDESEFMDPEMQVTTIASGPPLIVERRPWPEVKEMFTSVVPPMASERELALAGLRNQFPY